MELEILPYGLTICKAAEIKEIDLGAELLFIGKTDEELSLVCRTEDTPVRTAGRSDGWRAFRVRGVLDFSLTGILSKLSSVLAEREIGIFAVSTYNTDYILVRADDLERAVNALGEAGYVIRQAP